jgi:hypothetical protein
MVVAASVMSGSLLPRSMTFTPEPGISNAMVSAAALALASWMAARRVQLPAAVAQTRSPGFASGPSPTWSTVKVMGAAKAGATPDSVAAIASSTLAASTLTTDDRDDVMRPGMDGRASTTWGTPDASGSGAGRRSFWVGPEAPIVLPDDGSDQSRVPCHGPMR